MFVCMYVYKASVCVGSFASSLVGLVLRNSKISFFCFFNIFFHLESSFFSAFFFFFFLDIILKTAWYATWYFKNWHFGTFLFSKLVLLAAFFLQKSQVCEIVPFEKQKQPRVPVLKIRKFQSTSF